MLGKIDFMPIAQKFIESLERSEQEMIAVKLTTFYANCLRELADLQHTSFVHVSKIGIIVLLTNQRFLVRLADFVLVIEACGKTFDWNICSIRRQNPAQDEDRVVVSF